MIGYILLALAFILYLKGDRKYSILLFLTLVLAGFGVLSTKLLGGKSLDLAVIFTLLITLYHSIVTKNYFNTNGLGIWILGFILFIIASSFYSYIHYGFSWIQIFQASRFNYIILSYFFLIRLKNNNIIFIITSTFYITLVTAMIYIMQIVISRPILPYDLEYSFDKATGLIRLYNAPLLLSLFIFISFFHSQIIKFNLTLVRIVFLTALICTLGRTYIFTTIGVLIMGYLLTNNPSKSLKFILILSIAFLPFINIIMDRFSGETMDDLKSIQTGEYKSIENFGDATMAYRFGWIYERAKYLSHRPIGEKIFGLGFISDSQLEVNKLYNFSLGLLNEETGEVYQMGTPDISWGTMLTSFGYLGGLILTIIWIKLGIYFYSNWRNGLMFCFFLLIVSYFMTSISGSILSDIQSMVIFFIVFSLPNNKNENEKSLSLKKIIIKNDENNKCHL